MYDNEMKLEFLSKSSNEAFARITVAAFVSNLDPTIEELADINELVTDKEVEEDDRRQQWQRDRSKLAHL